MNIFGINVHFHKWVYIYEESHTEFMGRNIVDYYKSHRVCDVCGCVQHLDFYGVDWCTIGDNRANIVKDRMINDSYTTDDGYIVLNTIKYKLPKMM